MPPKRLSHPPSRLAAIAGVGLLHVAIYYAVTRLTLLRPQSAFIAPRLAIDDRIPHLAWTWPAYWLPYLLVPVVAGGVLARLDAPRFRRLVVAWSAMILVGGCIQVIWPAVAPWPASPSLTQRLYHDSSLIMPYATLPSMHIAHVTLLTLVTGTVLRQRWVRWLGGAATVLVALATLTLKEHLVLDSMSGLALGAAAWLGWSQSRW